MATTYTLTIEDTNIDEFRTGFLKMYPNTSQDPDDTWIKSVICETAQSIYEAGKRKIADETATTTDGIVS